MATLHLSLVAIKIVSMAEAPVEYSRKFLPHEISSIYKHLNIVRVLTMPTVYPKLGSPPLLGKPPFCP